MPPAPVHWVTPGQLPTPGTSIEHGSPPATPSSIWVSQSLSRPSHTSPVAVGASQPVQPEPETHISRPWQVPNEFMFVQVRTWPSLVASHVQLPVFGTQYEPVCSPVGSGPQV